MNMTTDEAIERIEKCHCSGSGIGHCSDDCMFGDEYCEYAMAIEALKREQWIPCKDRLPEQDVPVLVQKNCSCLVDGHYGRAVGEYNGFKYWTVEDDFYAEPIAWMPLPEPYKENNE